MSRSQGAGFLPLEHYLNGDKFLNKEQLVNIDDHKYASSGKTVLDPLMQHFWNNVVKLCPRSLAPNTITLIGLVFNLSGAIAAFYHCPTATEEAPSWVWSWNAATLFIYQTLDAIDGKQARRTGNSSPLGELFDHGMDSISMFLVMNTQLCAMKAGNEPLYYVIAVIIGCTGFYNAHWMTYITGKLEFGYFDVTEAQLSTIGIFLLTNRFGQEIWSYPILYFPLRVFAFYIPLAALFANQLLVQYAKITAGGAGPNGSTIAGTSVLSPLSNILSILAICYVFIQSKSSLLNNHPVLFSLYFGVTFAKISNCLIVAHMTKYEIQTSLWYFVYMGVGMYASNQWLSDWINGYWVLWVCFLYVTADLLYYMCNVYIEIADHLKIKIFKIKPVEPQTTSAATRTGMRTRSQVKKSD